MSLELVKQPQALGRLNREVNTNRVLKLNIFLVLLLGTSRKWNQPARRGSVKLTGLAVFSGW